MNEEAFREYLKTTITQKGKYIPNSRINQFINDLKKLIPEHLEENINLFDIDNIPELLKIKERLGVNGDLYHFHIQDGKGRPSSALYHYINFLDNIDYDGFKIYLQKKDYAEKTIRNNIAYIKRTLNILNHFDWFKGTNNQKILKFATQDNSFKKEFDKYHQYNPTNDSTFTNFRESARKYKDYLSSTNNSYVNIFHGLWIPKNEDVDIILNTGIWENKLSNKHRIKEQLEKVTIGDKVFLYQGVEDILIKESPFIKYLPNYRYSDSTIVKVTSLAIGIVDKIDFSNNSLHIHWQDNYSPNSWYLYFRQDGIWTFDDIPNPIKKQILYDIVFNNKKQNYEWWAKNGGFTMMQNENSIKTKNIILYGSPGIGKTHNYQNLITMIENNEDEKYIFDTIRQNNLTTLNQDIFKNIQDEKRVQFITFHQSYSYEDFIEGFRPNEDKSIKLEDGIFKLICKEAQNNSDKNYYLVIDEINRGNISKIFGELITLIEEDKRDEYEITLPYSKKPFKIPSNLFIIATMNSTDKSIATIDIALRRRFTFLKMLPNPDLVTYPKAKELMIKLNKFIEENLSEDFMIGHSYFMKVKNEQDLEFVVEYKIKPLLEEYFYADDLKLTEIFLILN